MDEYINIGEAARRLGVSEKTVRRWVKESHKLPGKIEQGRYVFAVSDLEALAQASLPPETDKRIEALEYRIAELETRVGTVEALYQALEEQLETKAARPPVRIHRPPRAEYTVKTEEEKEEAPAQPAGEKRALSANLVVAATYAKQHGIAPTTLQKAMTDGRLKAIPGTWVQGRATVKWALDEAGRVQFHQLYSSNPHFVAPDGCEECQGYELPEGLVDWQAFADSHYMNKNEVRRLISQGHIRGVKGPWKVGRRFTDKALDPKGRRDFWTQFHEASGFRSCDDCPHAPVE